MKKTFIIGSSGFVAKRHMDCLYALKQNVLGLYDKKTDGYSDRYFPNAKFFLNELNFIKYLRNFKGEKQLIVCSPNYLHTKHILLGLKNEHWDMIQAIVMEVNDVENYIQKANE